MTGRRLSHARVAMPSLVAAALAATLMIGATATAIAQPGQDGPGQTISVAQAGPYGGGPAGGRGRTGGPPGLDDGPWDFTTRQNRLHVSVVTKGLARPWGMAFAANGDILVTERRGRLRVIRDGSLDAQPIEGLPDIEPGLLGGLLDVALHPDFEINRFVYFTYSKPQPQDATLSATAVARGRWDGGQRLEEVEDIWVGNGWHGASTAGERCCGQGPPGGNFGGRLTFDEAGYLYVTSGDRHWGEMAQNPASHLGKIVRLHDDGSVPADNPFVGVEGFAPGIYSIGHRNPAGLSVNPLTGQLWSAEFGPRGGDEVNRIEAGANYGWMLVTGGEHYDGSETALGAGDVEGMIDPVLSWSPSINPGNLVFYSGDRFPQWRGDLLIAAMSQSLLVVEFDAAGNPVAEERLLTQLRQRIRDVRQGPDGLVYVLTDEAAGALLKIEPGD